MTILNATNCDKDSLSPPLVDHQATEGGLYYRIAQSFSGLTSRASGLPLNTYLAKLKADPQVPRF